MWSAFFQLQLTFLKVGWWRSWEWIRISGQMPKDFPEALMSVISIQVYSTYWHRQSLATLHTSIFWWVQMLKPAVLRVSGCTKCSFKAWPSSLDTNCTTSAEPTYFEEASCPGKQRTVFSEHHLCRDAVGTARHITPAEDAVLLQGLVQVAVILHLSALGITRSYGHFRTKGCWKLLHTFTPTVCNTCTFR